ncbi:MAG: hypothetical protein FJ399_13915, partial [Verrucomicrobia bacterium]|nr:hypothetical protein [Verrucomicrobiota bacterium]
MRSGRVAGDLLFWLWLALIGADRINLLGGVVSFVATPYLALTPLVVLVELARRRRAGSAIAISRTLTIYGAALVLVLALASASVVGSPALVKSAQRVVLLALHVLGTFAVAVAAGDRDDLDRQLARGAALGIVFFALFNALNLASVFRLVPEVVHWGPVQLSFKTWFYSSLFPRMAGPVIDVNRGGFILTIFGFLLWRGFEQGVMRRVLLVLATVMLLVTLSRSAIGTAVGALLVVAVTTGRLRPRRTQLAVASVAFFLAAVTTVLIPDRLAHAVAPLAPLTQRFSPREGSAAEHVDLLNRGVAAGSESVQRLAVGMGYGSAYTILQDLFPDNKYASFHSLFVTIFAECGVIALLAMVGLIGVPALLPNAYRGIAVGAAFFN